MELLEVVEKNKQLGNSEFNARNKEAEIILDKNSGEKTI